MTAPIAETGPETNIALAGQVCIDSNDIEGKQYTAWGSSVLHMADYYQQNYGIDPDVLATHGPDFTEHAERFSIYPKEPTAPQTLMYRNEIRNRVRRQHCFNASIEALPPVDPDVRAILGKSDVFFLAPLTPAYNPDYVEELLSHIPDDGLKVLLPQGYLREIGGDGTVGIRDFEEEPAIVSGFDLLILSDEDVPDAVGTAQEWRKKHPKTRVVVTQGAYGASIVEEDEEIPVHTTPVSEECSADSIGCGDTFSASLAFNFFSDPSDLYGATQKANTAARRKLLANLFND